MKKIVVLGAGYAGLQTVHRLQKLKNIAGMFIIL